MIETGLYTGGSAKAADAAGKDLGLRVKAASATEHNDYLQGGLAWRPSMKTKEMQITHDQVSNGSHLSFQCSVSP